MSRHYRMSVIGVSAGGLDALSKLVSALPADLSLPLAIVQHRSSDSGGFLATHLDGLSRPRVKEASDKEPVRPGIVYLAPANYHLLLEKGKYVEESETFALSVDERVNHSRPSIDVLFDSAANVFGRELIGVVLTGGNADGSRGLKHIKRNGGTAIVQDPATAEVDTMPKAAIEATQVDHVMSIEELALFLAECRANENNLDAYALAVNGA